MANGKVLFQLPLTPPTEFVDPRLVTELVEIHTALDVVRKEVATAPGLWRIKTSEALVKGAAVSITNDLAKKADRTLNAPAVGICLLDAQAGSVAQVLMMIGYLNVFSGLTPNKTYYLDTAGAITAVKPGSGLVQPLGYALSSTEMFLSISLP